MNQIFCTCFSDRQVNVSVDPVFCVCNRRESWLCNGRQGVRAWWSTMSDRFCSFAGNSYQIKPRNIYIKFWSESLEETGHLEDLGIVNGEFVTVTAMAAYRGSSGKVPFFITDDLTAIKNFLCRELNLGLSSLFTVLTTLSRWFLSVGGRVIVQWITKLLVRWCGLNWCSLRTKCLLFVVSLKKMCLVFIHVLYVRPHCHNFYDSSFLLAVLSRELVNSFAQVVEHMYLHTFWNADDMHFVIHCFRLTSHKTCNTVTWICDTFSIFTQCLFRY